MKLLRNFIAALMVCAFCAQPLGVVHAKEQLRLSSDDVKRMMLEQGYGVEQERLRSEAAKTDVMASKGIFDTNLGADVSHNIDDSTKTSAIFGNRVDTTMAGLAAKKKFATGTNAELGFRFERQKYFNSLVVNGQPIFPPNALYEPIISFALSQPVMKNAGGYIDRRSVKSAELGSLATDLDSQRQIETLVYGALNDYWNLVLIRRFIEARHKAVRFAEGFLATTREERKLGTAEETDVLAAEANVLVRKDQLLSVKELERVTQEGLRVKLGLSPEVEIDNAEKKPYFIMLTGTGEGHIADALGRRRDYQASKRELELRDVQLAVAKNQRWPQMDLYTTLELNEIKQSFNNAWGSVDSPNWTIGMNFKVPIENRAARAGKKRADIQKTSAVVALKDLENRIANNVVTSFDEVQARQQIVTLSKRAWDLQGEKLKQERDKYSLGRSTSDLVIRFQDDVVAAELAHFEAWLSYKSAALNLALAEGTLVEFDKLEEEDVAAQ